MPPPSPKVQGQTLTDWGVLEDNGLPPPVQSQKHIWKHWTTLPQVRGFFPHKDSSECYFLNPRISI